MSLGPQAVNGPQLIELTLKPCFLWLVVKKRIILKINVEVQYPKLYPHRKIAAAPLFNSLVSHFGKLIESSVDSYCKSE